MDMDTRYDNGYKISLSRKIPLFTNKIMDTKCDFFFIINFFCIKKFIKTKGNYFSKQIYVPCVY